MTEISLKEVNQILGDLDDLRNSNEKVSRVEDENDCTIIYEIYHIKSKDLYVRLTLKENSYDDEEYVSGIQFVKPVTKTIVAYENI